MAWIRLVASLADMPLALSWSFVEGFLSDQQVGMLGVVSSLAGIINYYQPGDTLTRHVDRSEPNMSSPLVSISLGLSCVFLIGGADRDDPVSAVLVRSGDVSMLSGPARRYYHGVPRVLDGSGPEHFRGDPFMCDSRVNLNLRQVY